MINKNIDYLKIVGILAVVIFFLSWLVLMQKEKVKIDTSATTVRVMPTLTIKTQGSLSLLKVNETTFEVYADSQGKDIVGYDILLGFDSSKANLISVLSTDPNFTIFKIKRANLLIITGIKKLTVKEPTVFAKTKILMIKGAPVTLVSKSGKETAKFVDSASKIYYPAVSY